MAGTDAGFDARQFRDGLLFAMRMGMPPDPADQPVFVMEPDPPTYTKHGAPVVNPRLDASGQPLDPEVKTVPAPSREVRGVLCAVEVTDASTSDMPTGQLDPVGVFRASKATVTVLDEQRTLIDGCRQLRYAGNIYNYGYTSQTVGLFDVGVTQMIFFALDQE